MVIRLATAGEREEARGFALAYNGAQFCPDDAAPRVLLGAVRSYPQGVVDWVLALDDAGDLVGVSGFVVGVPDLLGDAADLHSLVTAVDPTAYTPELAEELIKGIARLAAWPNERRAWWTVMGASSPALALVRDVYGEADGRCAVTSYAAGLVRIEGTVNGLPWLAE